MNKKIVSLALVLGMAVMLGACNSGDGGTGGSPSPAGSPATTAPTTPKATTAPATPKATTSPAPATPKSP